MLILGISAQYKQSQLTTLVPSIEVITIPTLVHTILIGEISLTLDGKEISLEGKSLNLNLKLKLKLKINHHLNFKQMLRTECNKLMRRNYLWRNFSCNSYKLNSSNAISISVHENFEKLDWSIGTKNLIRNYCNWQVH